MHGHCGATTKLVNIAGKPHPDFSIVAPVPAVKNFRSPKTKGVYMLRQNWFSQRAIHLQRPARENMTLRIAESAFRSSREFTLSAIPIPFHVILIHRGYCPSSYPLFKLGKEFRICSGRSTNHGFFFSNFFFLTLCLYP